MATPKELLDELLRDCKSSDDLLGKNGVLKQLTKDLVERMLEAEMTDHLGYDKHAPEGRGSGNSRNGSSPKTVVGDQGEIPIDVPRDRNGDFEPQVVPKGQRRLPGFDDKIISMYARGMTTREIQGHLEEQYGVEVSPTLISKVTDAVVEEVTAWQNRPLDPLYPVLYLDALQVKVRDQGTIRNKAIYLALGIGLSGTKELLGLWLSQTEGAKEILSSVVDGKRAYPAISGCFFHLTVDELNTLDYLRDELGALESAPVFLGIGGQFENHGERGYT